MKCSKCGYVYNGVEDIRNCPKCGQSYGNLEEEGLSNKSKAAVAIGAAAGAVAGLANLTSQNGNIFASENKVKNNNADSGSEELIVDNSNNTSNQESAEINNSNSSEMSTSNTSNNGNNSNDGSTYGEGGSSTGDSINIGDVTTGGTGVSNLGETDGSTDETEKGNDEIDKEIEKSDDGDTESGQGSEETGEGDTESGEGSEETGEGDTESGEGSEETGEGDTESGEGSEETSEGDTESGEGSEESGEGDTESGEGTEETGEGDTESGEGTEETGAGDTESGEGSEETGEGDTESGEGTEETGEGDTESGEGTEETGEGDAESGEGTEETGEGDTESGEGTEETGEGDTESGEGSEETGAGDTESGEGTEGTPDADSQQQSSGGGGGIGDIDFGPADLDSVLGYFDLGHAYNNGSEEFGLINEGEINVASKVQKAFDKVSNLKCIKEAGTAVNSWGAYNILIGAVGTGGSGGYLAELKANLKYLHRIYTRMCGGEDAYNAYVDLDIKTKVEEAHKNEGDDTTFEQMMTQRGIALDDLAVTAINNLNNYFDAELERLQASDKDLTKAELEETFLYRITNGAIEFDTREELIQGYIDQIDALCLTMNFLGNITQTNATPLIDLNETYIDDGITYDQHIYNNVIDGIDRPYYDGDGEIPDGMEDYYKSDIQMQLEKSYYNTCTSIDFNLRSEYEQLLIDAVNDHIESYASNYYYNHGSTMPIPSDSHVYQLAKIGVINESFKIDDKGNQVYLGPDQRSESGNRIVELWNEPWITGTTSEKRIGRDVFEETFNLTQLYNDKYSPEYEKTSAAYESMFEKVVDENGVESYVLKPAAARSYFQDNFSEEELRAIFGPDSYPYVPSSNCNVLTVSDEELMNGFIANCPGASAFVNANPDYFTVDENGNKVLKPDISPDIVIGAYITQQYEQSATRMFNIGDQMRLLNTLTPYMSSTVNAQRQQYQDLYDATWDQYNADKSEYERQHAEWEKDPEKYGEEPVEPERPNLSKPDEVYPLTSAQTGKADDLYLGFANGITNNYLNTNVPITEYLPDCSAYDGWEPPVDFDSWKTGKFSADMLEVFSYQTVDVTKLPVAEGEEPMEAPTIDAEALYTSFCDSTVQGLINANKTYTYINQKFNTALAFEITDLDAAIAAEQATYDEALAEYNRKISGLNGCRNAEAAKKIQAEAAPYLEAVQESRERLNSLNEARTSIDLVHAEYQGKIDAFNMDLNEIVPRLSTFDPNQLKLISPNEDINDYVEDYVTYTSDGYPVVIGKQLNAEALSEIETEVRNQLASEDIQVSDFKTPEEYEAYVDQQVAYRQAMYIMEIQNSGVYVNLASCSPLVKSYVESFGYLKQNNGDSTFTNTLYCMEYAMQTQGIYEFSSMFNNTYTAAFNFEAERRANEYLNSWAQDLKDKWDDDGMNVLEWIGYGLAEFGEHTWEDVLVPMGNGIAGSVKGIGKAFENLFEDISGQEINPINLVSINDAMWDNIYRIGAQTGQLSQLQTYVMQAANSVGNMAIPMVLGLCGLGGLSTAWMAVSAFGNTIEECKREIANGNSDMSLIGAYAYSVLSAASEVVMEKVLGAMPGVGKAASTGFKGVINSMLSEAKEEAIQTFVDPALKDLVMGTEALIKYCNGDVNAFKNVNWAVDDLTAKDFVDAAIVAMISSGMTSSVKIVKSTASLIQYGNSSIIEISALRQGTLMAQGMTEAQAKAMVRTELSQIATNSSAFNAQLEAALNNPDVKAAYEAQQQLFDEAKKADKNFSDPKAELSFTDFAIDMVYSQTVAGGMDVSSTLNAYSTILNANMTEMTKLEGQLAKLQESLATADADGKTKIEAQIETVQGKIDAIKTKLPALQIAYSQAVESQQESLTFYENTYDNLIKEVSELTDKKNQLEAKSELTESEQQTLNEINEQIQNIYDNRLPALEQVINETRSEIESRIEQTQNAIDSMEQQQHDLRVEMETANDQRVTEIQQQLKTNQETITDLTVQMKSDQISLNTQNNAQLENKITTLQDLIAKNDGSNPALNMQLEHTQRQLADVLVAEKNWLNRNNQTLNNEKLAFREGATTGSIDQLIADNQTRIEQIDQKLDTLREAGIEVNDGSNRVEVGQNVSASIETKQTALTYLTATIGGGAATIGGVTSNIDQKITGLRSQLTNLQKQGNKKNKGSKADPEIRKKKAELKQQINEHKQVKQELLKSMHEYGMNNNSPITDFMDALQLDLDGLHDVGGKFVDASFKQELETIKIEGLTSQASKQIQSLTISVNEFISYMNAFRAVDKSNPKVLEKFNKDVSAFFNRAKTVTASLAAKIPNIKNMSSMFDSFGEKLKLLHSFPTNTRNELLNQYNGLQLEINDIVTKLGRGKPELDAQAIADLTAKFETFQAKFTEEVAKVVDVNMENVSDVLGKAEVDSLQEFNHLFESISDVLGKLTEFSDMSEMVSNIEIVGSQLTDLFNLTKTQAELESLFKKQSTTDEIIEKLSELKNNIVKYSKEAFKSKVKFETVADMNSDTITETKDKLNIVDRVSTAVTNLLERITNLIKTNVVDPADKIRISGTLQYITTEVIDFTSGIFTDVRNYSQIKLNNLVGKIKELALNIKTSITEVDIALETANKLINEGDIKLLLETIDLDPKLLGTLLDNGVVDFLKDPSVPDAVLTAAAEYIKTNRLNVTLSTDTDVSATIRLLLNGFTVNYDASIKNDLCRELADLIEPLDIVDSNLSTLATKAFVPLFREISTNPDSLALATDIINKLSDAHSAMLAEMLSDQKYISYTNLTTLLTNSNVDSIRNIMPALSLDTKKVLLNKMLVEYSTNAYGSLSEGSYEVLYDAGVEIIEYIKTIADNKLTLSRVIKQITKNYSYVNGMKNANDILKSVASTVGRSKMILFQTYGQNLLGGRAQYIDGVRFNMYSVDTNNAGYVYNVVNQFLQNFADSRIPTAVKQCLQNASFYDIQNPEDYYWSLEYGVNGWKDIRSGFVSGATGGGGTYTSWLLSGGDLGTISHELGHSVDTTLYQIFYAGQDIPGSDGYFSKVPNSSWQQAAAADGKPISEYGKNSPSEDLADSLKEFVTNRTEFENNFENRAKELKRLLMAVADSKYHFDAITDMDSLRVSMNIESSISNTDIDNWISQGYTFDQIKSAYAEYMAYGDDISTKLASNAVVQQSTDVQTVTDMQQDTDVQQGIEVQQGTDVQQGIDVQQGTDVQQGIDVIETSNFDIAVQAIKNGDIQIAIDLANQDFSVVTSLIDSGNYDILQNPLLNESVLTQAFDYMAQNNKLPDISTFDITSNTGLSFLYMAYEYALGDNITDIIPQLATRVTEVLTNTNVDVNIKASILNTVYNMEFDTAFGEAISQLDRNVAAGLVSDILKLNQGLAVSVLNTNPDLFNNSNLVVDLLDSGITSFLSEQNTSRNAILTAINYLSENGRLSEIADITFNANTDVGLAITAISNGLKVTFDNSIRIQVFDKYIEMLNANDTLSVEMINGAARLFIPVLNNPNSAMAVEIVNSLAGKHSKLLAEMLEGARFVKFETAVQLLSNCSVDSIRAVLSNLSISSKLGLFKQTLSMPVINSLGFYELKYDTGLDTIREIIRVYDDVATRDKIVSYVTADFTDVKGLTDINDVLKEVASTVGRTKRILYRNGQDLQRTEDLHGVPIKVYASNTSPENIERLNAIVENFRRNFANTSIPKVAKMCLEVASFYDVTNPEDYYWSIQYGVNGWKDIRSGFVSAATGGYGTYTSWNFGGSTVQTIAHELGHSLDTTLYKLFYPGQGSGYYSKVANSSWQQAIAADGKPVSKYGKNSPSEDLADSLKAFVTDRKAFERNFPNRAAELKRLLMIATEAKLDIANVTDMQSLRDLMIKNDISATDIDSWLAQGFTEAQIKEAFVSHIAYGDDMSKLLKPESSSGLLSKMSSFFKKAGDIVDIADNVVANPVVSQVNQMIATNGFAQIDLTTASQMTVADLKQISDLSKVEFYVSSYFSDMNGQIKVKYAQDRYRRRHTYSGYELLSINARLEQLQSKIDMSQPISIRARQIYELLKSEIPIMYDYTRSQAHVDVSQSLRGITSNNTVGKEGLICAGFASVFKEMCIRCNVPCDYVRGQAILDPLTGRGGRHAWNVVIAENGKIIPVDATWHEDTWFGGSERFAQTHIADSDEVYNDYSGFEGESDRMISHIVQTMDAKRGYGTGIAALRSYLETGDVTKITRTDGARDLLSQLTFDEINQYLNSHPVVSNTHVSDLNNVFTNLVARFGSKDQAIVQLREYVRTGDLKYITSQGGARDIIQRIPMSAVKEYLNGHLSNPSTNVAPSMVVEVDVNPEVIDEALRINEPPQVQSPSEGLSFSGNQSIDALNAQVALQNAVAVFRNAFGMIDVGQAETSGVVTIERDPLKAKEGAREKNWVYGQNGSFLFKKTLGVNYEAFGEILGYEFANLIKLDCAKYDFATLDGVDGVISYNISSTTEELISGKDILTTVEQFYIKPMLDLISRYQSIIGDFNLESAKLKDKKAVISELISLYNSTFARSEGFTKFVESIKVEKITSRNFDKIFNKFKEYYDTLSDTYEYSFSDWNNKKKVVKSNNLYDVWTLLDKYCDLHGYTVADGHNIMRDLVKMTVYDLILYQGDRHISNWSIIRDKQTNVIRFAPIYDNSNICNLNEGRDKIAQKASAILAFEKNKDRLSGAKLDRTIENLIRQVTGNDSKMMVEYADNEVKGNNIEMLRKLIEISDQDTVDMIREVCAQFSQENITAMFERVEAEYKVQIPNDVKVLVAKTIEVNMEKINELFDDHGDSDNSSPSSSDFVDNSPSMFDDAPSMDAPSSLDEQIRKIDEQIKALEAEEQGLKVDTVSDITVNDSLTEIKQFIAEYKNNPDIAIPSFADKTGTEIFDSIYKLEKDDLAILVKAGVIDRTVFDKVLEMFDDRTDMDAHLSELSIIEGKNISSFNAAQFVNNLFRAYSNYIGTFDVNSDVAQKAVEDLKYMYNKILGSTSSVGTEYRNIVEGAVINSSRMDFTGTYFTIVYDCVSDPSTTSLKLVESFNAATKKVEDTIIDAFLSNIDTFFNDTNLSSKYSLNDVSSRRVVEILKTLTPEQLSSFLKNYSLNMFDNRYRDFISSLSVDQRFDLICSRSLVLPLFGASSIVGDFTIDQKLHLITEGFISDRIFDVNELYAELSVKQLIDLARVGKFNYIRFEENVENGVYSKDYLVQFMEMYTSAANSYLINSTFSPSHILAGIFRSVIRSETEVGAEMRAYVKDLVKKMYEDMSIDDSEVLKSFLGLIQSGNLNTSKHYNHLSERNQILYLTARDIARVEESFVTKTPVYVHNIDGGKINFYACDADHAKLYAMKLEKIISRIPDGNFKKLLLQTEISIFGVSDFGNYAAGIRYNMKNFISAASAYSGHIDLYVEGINESEINVLGTFCHETGHIVDNAVKSGKWTTNDSTWGELTKFEKELYAGKAVTKYGETFYSEDFADSFKLYFRDTALFRQMYPVRALQLENILSVLDENGNVGDFDIVVPKVETIEGGYKIVKDETSGRVLAYLMFDTYNRNVTLDVSKAIELFLDDDIDITKYFTEQQIADYHAGNLEAVDNSLWQTENGEITEDVVESNDNDDSDYPGDSPSSSDDTIEPPSINEDVNNSAFNPVEINKFFDTFSLEEIANLKDAFINGDDGQVIDAIIQRARLGKNGVVDYSSFGTIFTGVKDEATLKKYLVELFNSANRMTKVNSIQFKTKLFDILFTYLNNTKSVYSAANAFEDIANLYFNYMLNPSLKISNTDSSMIKLINEELRQKLVSSNIQLEINGVRKRAYSILDFTDENIDTFRNLLEEVRKEKLFGQNGLIKSDFFTKLLGENKVDTTVESSILSKIKVLHFDPNIQKRTLAISILQVIYGFNETDSKLIYENILLHNVFDTVVKADGSKVTIFDVKDMGYSKFYQTYIEGPKMKMVNSIIDSFDGIVTFDKDAVRKYVKDNMNMQSSDVVIKELIYDYCLSNKIITDKLKSKITSDLVSQFTLGESSYFNGKTIRFKSTNKIAELIFDSNDIRLKENASVDFTGCKSFGEVYMKFISSSIEVKLTNEIKKKLGTPDDYITLDKIKNYGYEQLDAIRYVQRCLCAYIYINLDKAGFVYDNSEALSNNSVFDESKCYFRKGNLRINYESIEHILMYNEFKSASGGHYDSLFLWPYSIKNDASGEVVDSLNGYVYKNSAFHEKDGGRVMKTIWPSTISLNRIFDIAEFVFDKGVADNHLVRVIAKGKPDSNMMYFEFVDGEHKLFSEIESIFGESIDNLIVKLYSCVTGNGLLVTFYPSAIRRIK